jgi:hypothetical protein
LFQFGIEHDPAVVRQKVNELYPLRRSLLYPRPTDHIIDGMKPDCVESKVVFAPPIPRKRQTNVRYPFTLVETLRQTGLRFDVFRKDTDRPNRQQSLHFLAVGVTVRQYPTNLVNVSGTMTVNHFDRFVVVFETDPTACTHFCFVLRKKEGMNDILSETTNGIQIGDNTETQFHVI